MADDELNGEVSISAQLSENGITASAKSRLLSALDWAGGSYIAAKFRSKASKTVEDAAVAKGRLAIIDTAAQMAIEKMKTDSDVADAVIKAHFGTMFVREENKSAAFECAVEDLENAPPTAEQSNSGPDRLSDEMLNRWGRYAEDASSDELRQRWGRVLAAEVRRPGTFSAKVLRVVDEMDISIATAFERICEHRLGKVILKSQSGALDAPESWKLVSAGLMVDPGAIGQVAYFGSIADGQGNELWSLTLSNRLIAFRKGARIAETAQPDTAVIVGGAPSPMVPIYVLTAEGEAIASILDNKEVSVFNEFAARLVEAIGPDEAYEYSLTEGGQWQRTKIWRASSR